MTPSSLKVLNWNIEWKRFSRKAGKVIHKILMDESPDLICLTESFTENSLAGFDGIFSEDDYGYSIKPGRRKVTLWSKTPWTDDTNSLPGAPSGRFVSGITKTEALGDLRVIGLCVPWESAHVSTGRKDRTRWQDHASFLECFLKSLETMKDDLPTLILGDFNQTFPPKRAPKPVRELFCEIVEQFNMVPKAQPESRTVSHMLVDSSLEGSAIRDIDNYLEKVRLSDHRGHIAKVQRV